MFKKTKRRGMKFFVITAVVLSAAIVFAGCGNTVGEKTEEVRYQADTNLNPPGEVPICKEPVTLKIIMAQDSLVEDFDTNKYTKKLEEYGNMDLEFELIPSADMSTKLNLLMNANGDDLPDIIIGSMSNQQIVSFGESGMIIPLNQYYENSSKYLKEGIESKPDKNILSSITSADGNIYTIPRYNESIHNEFYELLWIYKPWLDQLGLEVPKTLDEYEAALQAFKDNDMNGNGDASDEIPLLDRQADMAIYDIMNAFISFDSGRDYLVNNDGKLSFAFMDDKWKEGLKYLNGLCEKGLLSPISFTMDATQFKSILAAEPNRVGSFSWSSPSCVPATSLSQAGFVAVNPKKYDDKYAYLYRKTVPEPMFFITKSCKNPEAAFRLGDLMCSEEMTIWNRWGEKGVDWVEPDENDKGLYEFCGYDPIIKPVLQWGSIQNSHWDNVGPGFRGYEIAAGATAGNDISQIAKANAIRDLNLLDDNHDSAMDNLVFDSGDLEEYSDLMLTIKTYVTEQLAQFVAGNSDIDQGWDAYISELKNMDVDRALELAQASYDSAND